MGSINIAGVPFVLPTTNILPPAPINVVVVTAYTFGLSDAQAYTVFTSSASVTATVPQNLFPLGTQLTCEQSGVGAVVFTPAVGVTFNPTGTRGTIGQYAVVSFMQKFTNIWTCTGAFI